MEGEQVTLTELRRQAVALAVAQSAITQCCVSLGDWTTNDILVKLNSTAREVQDRIDMLEKGICPGTP